MNITIIGHGHLAYVTAACMEQYHKVNVDDSKAGQSELIWVCYDTPVDEEGKPSSAVIVEKISELIPSIQTGSIILISTQIPVGTCAELKRNFPGHTFACSPENLRRGKAIQDFLNPERIVVGCDDVPRVKEVITSLLSPLNRPIFLTSIETAEMIKHALNSFLAVSIAFINEIDTVCKATGANSLEVAYGLQSDKRVGFLSYLKPGGPYTNDTLGREIHTIIELDNKLNLGLNLIPAIKKSNDAHRNNGK